MPRLPKGMVRRGSAYYFREMKGGVVTRRSLGKDYAEAYRRFRLLKEQGVSAGSDLTVAAAAQEWLQTYIPNARGEYGIKQAKDRVKRFLVPVLGHLRLDRLTSQDLRSYRLSLEKRGLSPMTVTHLLSDARCFLNWAEGAGRIDRSPFPKRIMPRLQQQPPDRLSDSEVEKVLAVSEPYAFVIRLGLGTALRWGEMVRAQASDVVKGMLVVSRTKSGKVRRVPLPPELLMELRTRIGRLVPFSSSGQFNARVREHSGVKRFHVHQLRHTAACRWLEAGGSLPALQEILGHSSIVTTQRYGRLSDAAVAHEAEGVFGKSGRRSGHSGPVINTENVVSQ